MATTYSAFRYVSRQERRARPTTDLDSPLGSAVFTAPRDRLESALDPDVRPEKIGAASAADGYFFGIFSAISRNSCCAAAWLAACALL